MDRNAGKGPFAGVKFEDTAGPTVVGDGAVVRDSTEAVFCYVSARDCHGGDLSAAKARAQLIAESLNRDDKRKAALIKAREIIQSERDTTVECATLPPHDDLTTLDDQTRPFVEQLDLTLAEIDEALR